MNGGVIMSIVGLLSQAVESGDSKEVRLLVARALEENLNPLDILNEGLLAGIEIVGKKFGQGELFIPEVMICARALQEGIDTLRPYLQGKDTCFRGKIVLGTVAGDIHDLGKNLVKMMFTANGFEVIDLGVDVSPEKFVAALKKHKPGFIGLSALLTTTMLQMERTIRNLRESDWWENNCLIMVGGAPVTGDFACSIGADIYADNAIEAVELARKAVGS